jgi:2-polyprenyl-6-methoxyphenol hydroxylase-like FAD-dependent oxidoreductase
VQHPSGKRAAVAAFDVAVVGGGPAGAATCLRLAGSGLRVGLFERSHFQAPRVGEVLAPAVGQLLHQLGVHEDVEHAGFARCHGVSSIWGSDRLGSRDFVFGPHGWGWQVERRVFDALLCAAASARSAQVHLGAVVNSCQHNSGDGWCLTVEQAHQIRTYRARFLVVATGRSGVRGTFSDRTRIRDDRLVGLVRYLDATGSAISHTRVCIEAVRDGWWYTARLPNDISVAAYLTDADLMPRHSRSTETMWSGLVEAAPLIRSLLEDQAPQSSPRLDAAGSRRRSR